MSDGRPKFLALGFTRMMTKNGILMLLQAETQSSALKGRFMYNTCRYSVLPRNMRLWAPLSFF